MEETSSPYESLAAHLDKLPSGFPRTSSGVELRILRRLFTPEEAALAQFLIFKPETAEQIAARAQQNARELALKLDAMSRKGLIFRMRKGDETRFMAAQFIVGIWEYHVNDLDPELIRDVNEYLPTLFQHSGAARTPQLRTIPISRALTPEQPIMPYEVARTIIESQDQIAVAPCICRREHQMTGSGCGKVMESCLIFGVAATYYEENGLGRSIGREEALKILERAEEEGLVLQPSNSQKVVNICTCCGCCCQILKNLKRLPRPAEYVAANYFVVVDRDKCIGCEICLERCQMEAVRMEDGVATIDKNRCIGCGLCVPTCDAAAMHLEPKEPGARREPPVSLSDTYLRIIKERVGKG